MQWIASIIVGRILSLHPLMVKKYFLFNACWLFFLFAFLSTSCQYIPRYESPEGYNFSSPEKILMKESLLEISGITFYPHSDTLLAINDESGKLFFFTLNSLKPRVMKFAGGGDYEDIAIYNDSIYVLRSDGSLFTLPDSLADKTSIASGRKKPFPKAEYESMCIDEGHLYVMCKQYGKKKNKNILKGYVLDLRDTSNVAKPFEIDVNSLMDENNKKEFMPSAIAKNKQTGEWYVLSSVNKSFLIADSDWKPKKILSLDPAIFIQPEGMTFDSQNNLYISNEGNDLRNGNILKFEYHSSK
jgi:uncharacterized protein YjiK